MKVHELIKELQQYPPDFDIVVAADEEGNDYHLGYDTSLGWYDEQSRDFKSHIVDDAQDEYNLEYTERARTLDESNSVCIWP